MTMISCLVSRGFHWHKRPSDLKKFELSLYMKTSWGFAVSAKVLFCLWLSTHTQLSPLSGHLTPSQMSPGLQAVTRLWPDQEKRDSQCKQGELSMKFGVFVTREPLRTVCFDMRCQVCNHRELTLHLPFSLTFVITTYSGHNHTQVMITKSLSRV